MRAISQLFTLAEEARERDALASSAVGARGYGFALADQHETQRFRAGGAKLANLPSHTNAGLVAHVVGLVDGRVALRAHLEELFTLTLCAVSPAGGRCAVSFYHGPSGLALGDDPYEGLSRSDGEELAAAWQEALCKAPMVDFQLAVDSDFGRSWLVVRDGTARHEKKKQPDVSEPPPLGSHDPAGLVAALERSGEGCELFDALTSAWDTTNGVTRKSYAQAYDKKLRALWPAALDELEAALASGTLSPAAERAAPLLLFPQSFELDAERRNAMYDQWHTITRRSTAPWS